MKKQKLLCFGCGYTAQHLARLLINNGWDVAGTTRSEGKAAALKQIGISPILWDHSVDKNLLNDVTAILISTPPGDDGCPTLDSAGSIIAQHAPALKWVGYLSTNGVYGDHGGAWVDENSKLLATSDRGRRRIEAETAWRSLAKACRMPFAIFRLPGIYGPGRSAFDSIKKGTAKRIYKEGQVFSRMHVDDISGALYASMSELLTHDVYNLADDEPAPPQDVIEYACCLLDVEPPPLVNLEEAGLSEMGKSFYADNKRISNARMKEALNFTPAFTSYREGLNAIFQKMRNEV